MCPNACTGHGDCDHFNRCKCFAGWDGGDCSERKCATGIAWSDEATGVDVAHALTECSNRGTCDRAKGLCQCMPGFTGAACDRMSCPNDNYCSGHGSCHSMQEYAEHYRDSSARAYTYDSQWDSKAIHTCVCDSGYAGYDCSLRECPRGDDPQTTGQVNEVQLIRCHASGGTWALVYEDEMSLTLGVNADATAVKAALEAIPSIYDVNVVFSAPGTPACSLSDNQVS
jgi:EGF-like domain